MKQITTTTTKKIKLEQTQTYIETTAHLVGKDDWVREQDIAKEG